MKNYEQILKSIGLDNNEAKVYLEAIKLGSTQASIIGKRLGIPRTTARYACEELVKKNLMSKIKKGNSMIFTAEKPNLLKNQIQIQKNKLEEDEDKLNNIMGDLMGFYNPHTKLPKVTFYEGIEGAKKVLDETIKAGEIIDAFLDLGGILHMDEINKYYAEQRLKHNIEKRLIINEINGWEEFAFGLYGESYLNKIKPLKKYYIKNILFMMFDGKISYISFNGDNIISVIIENEDIYRLHKNIYSLIWNSI